jgi:putative holliday junction resolvase
MRLLGIDYGEKRIGLAYGDEIGVAVPLEAAIQRDFEGRMDFIAKTITARHIEKLIVGYPYNMDGTVGFKAREVDSFITKLEKRFGLPVERVDETLTSVEAEGGLGKSRKGIGDVRKRRSTGHVDSSAAALILRDYLENVNKL